MATTLVEHPTPLPKTPPDMSCHLRPRSTGKLCQCMINGVLYNITIRHKTTGENVALLPGNQAMINRLAQGVFTQLMATSGKAGVRNFNERDVEKITVDLEDLSQPDAVTYQSATDTHGQALDSAQTFSLDPRIVQTVLPEFRKASNVAVSLRRVCTASVEGSVTGSAVDKPRRRGLEDERDIPERRVIGTVSQYGVDRGLGRAACAVMSLVAIEKMRTEQLNRTDEMDEVLQVGSALYGRIIERIANSLITRRDSGDEPGVIGNFFLGLGQRVPVLTGSRPDQLQTLSRALHGMHLHWREIDRYLPGVVGHELRNVLNQYDISAETTSRLGSVPSRSDENQYRALLAPLVGAATEDQPAFGLLTLGGETYAVRVLKYRGHTYIDFVNSHGEAQLNNKAAKRTFEYEDFIIELTNRHPRIDPLGHDFNLIGLIVMTPTHDE